MKRIYLLISILLFFSGIHAQQYILLQFSSQENIPSAEYSEENDNYTITCSDEALTKIFTDYNIKIFTKEFPQAYLVNHANAEPLDRVYRIGTTGNATDLYNNLVSANSSTISGTIYLLNEPIALAVPNDYNLICFNPVCVPRCSNLQNDLVNAPAAWDITTGNASIRVGVADVNFRRTHEDISGKVVLDNASAFNPFGQDHGSAVAVLAAGNTNNGVGIASVGYNCKADLYNMTYSDILSAAINGARIVNCSWEDGFCAPVSFYQNMINMIHDSLNTVIIAAAGNGSGSSCGITGYYYPASYNHVISVTAVGHIQDVSSIGTCNSYSFKDVHDYKPSDPSLTYTHNDKVDLCAPAYAVTSAWNNSDNAYRGNSGTSFASPMVSATAALILSVNSSLTPDDVEAILKCSARDVYEIPYNINYLNLLGWGRIDAGKAVQLAQAWTPGTGGTQQSAPTDIRWFEILSNGTNTIEVEGTCSSNTAGYCNIGFRLEVVHSNSSLTFKWLSFYSESGVNISNSIKYGNSIYLIRGIDYPMTDVTGGSIKACVRVDECIPSLYYSEDRASSCFGPACTYPCPSDIYITGNYSTALTESYTWIKSIGQTTISTSSSVKLDASPTQGYIEFKPVSSSDYLLSAPGSSGVFIVQPYNGCTSGAPSFAGGPVNNLEEDNPNRKDIFSVFPNPGTGLFTVRHPADVKEMQVVDMYGKVILRITNLGSKQTKINLSNVPAGMFILHTDGKKYVTKIIKK